SGRFSDPFRNPLVGRNRPAAAATTATDAPAKPNPDATPLTANSAVTAINQSLYAKLPFNATRDFAPISPMPLPATATVVHPPLAPDVPTIAEAAGLPGYEAVAWMGVLGPAGLPQEVVGRLNGEVGRLAKLPEVREWLAKQGLEPDYSTPEAFAQRIQTDAGK